jgi:3-phenylpropionate/cinnamic acid dioxygenase small subunit
MTHRATAAVDQSGPIRGLTSQLRVPVGSEVYNRILETLYDEAAALDERRFDDWTPMLAEDLIYTAPLRLTRTGTHRNHDVVRTMFHFDDDYLSILARTDRMKLSAWAEDPPSRCRRFVTNVRVAEAEEPDAFEVVSYLFLERSRGPDHINERTTAERRDIWRRYDDRFRLARREIILDQSTLAMSNLAIFL